MKLIPTNEKELERTRTKSDIFSLLMEFQESTMDCAKVEDYPHKSAKSCANSISIAIKKYRLGTIRVTQRGEDVFLIRKKI